VTLTPEGYLAWLDAVEAKERQAARAVAEAMAQHVADRIRNDTLRRRKTAPGQYYRAVRGEPPAYGTGRLARSIYTTTAEGGALRASALVGSTDKRAALFEFGGCVLQPGDSRSVMKWKDSGNAANPSGWWSHHKLPLSGTWPEHPFLRPTVEEVIDDGSLREAAIRAFLPYDP
jgi:phage gpG-like protein